MFNFVKSLNVDKFGFMNVFCSTELFHVDFLKITADNQPLMKILQRQTQHLDFNPKLGNFCF